MSKGGMGFKDFGIRMLEGAEVDSHLREMLKGASELPGFYPNPGMSRKTTH